jgi:hypothetical protein
MNPKRTIEAPMEPKSVCLSPDLNEAAVNG